MYVSRCKLIKGQYQEWVYAGLTLPALCLVGVIILLPFGFLAWTSMFDTSGAPSAENYLRLLRPAYVQAFLSTLELSAVVSLLCVLLGYPVAYLLSQLPPRAAQILLVLVLLPFWTSVLVRTYAWLVLLQRHGVINKLLIWTGAISEPLTLVNNWTGTIIGMVHVMLPFLILPLYASMKVIDSSLMRAAASCGAGPTKAFWQIYLPLTLPGLLAGVTLTFVMGLGFYLTPALLGGGRVATLSVMMADAIRVYSNWGAASALGVTLVVVTGLFLFSLRLLSRMLHGRGGSR